MATFIRLVNELDISADELLKDQVKRADYLVDAEVSSKLNQMSPRQRTAVLKILDSILETLPFLTEEKNKVYILKMSQRRNALAISFP